MILVEFKTIIIYIYIDIFIDIDRYLNLLELTYSKYNNGLLAVLSLISLAPLHMRAERVVP